MTKPLSRRIPHDRLIFLYALLGGLPAVAVALDFLWRRDHPDDARWILSLLILACWIGFASALRERVARPLQTMSNLLFALREGDFSVRARWAARADPMGDALTEINLLSRELQANRFHALEAFALLNTVMQVIDVAIFAFDDRDRLRLANQAAHNLLALPRGRLLGRTAAELGLSDTLQGEASRLLNRPFPSGPGRWSMRRSPFRQDGRRHQLVVIADLSSTLREEELRAWQSLVRVLGHELNNSLAPIKSLAGSLDSLFQRSPRAPDWEDDMHSGLSIIATRADSLGRFVEAYTRLARLPKPARAPCSIRDLVNRVVTLETRRPVRVVPSPAADLNCDGAQIEQLLINLVRNAVDASLERTEPESARDGVTVTWEISPREFILTVTDDGAGVANPDNLFVPFFTTKPQGNGIGLVLSRQIAENHGGSLVLKNRADASGCVAVLHLPV